MARTRVSPSVALLFVLALSCAAAGSTPALGQARNLLVNPGFEIGVPGHPWMPTGWDTSRAGMETVFFGRDSFSAHTGQYGVSVANASAILPLSHNWSQTLFITPDMWGKDLVFSAWTRSDGVEGRGYIMLQAYRDTIGKMARIWGVSREDAGSRLRIFGLDDPAADLGWKRVPFAESETDWVQRSARVYVAPTTNMTHVRCGLIGTGQVSLDDASLTLEDPLPAEEPPLNVNLLSDPGFETQPNAWEYSLPPYPAMRAVLDTVVFHSGRSSVRFSGAGGMVPGRAGAAQVLCNRALSGKRLRLSAWVRAESLKTSAYLKIFCHTDSGMKQEASPRAVAGTTDWVPVIVECDAPRGTYAVWVWGMYTAPTPGRLWLDDMSLEVLGPATGAPTPIQNQFLIEKPPTDSSVPRKPAPGKVRRPARSRP